ncbi:hypothetical protein TL16_g04882 [Triparma laevis f. inornata]|uniref:DM2 domain-containing protein n=1 Tax=Triparma laevis f. inornata TaxID=1714386 RepID=A0A9W7A9Y5_9STRA|nr:hypothetical protein TL16_g04882 [Triparma laevis f. inornata]
MSQSNPSAPNGNPVRNPTPTPTPTPDLSHSDEQTLSSIRSSSLKRLLPTWSMLGRSLSHTNTPAFDALDYVGQKKFVNNYYKKRNVTWFVDDPKDEPQNSSKDLKSSSKSSTLITSVNDANDLLPLHSLHPPPTHTGSHDPASYKSHIKRLEKSTRTGATVGVHVSSKGRGVESRSSGTAGNFSMAWDGSVNRVNGEDGSGIIFRFVVPEGESSVVLEFGKRGIEARFTPCQPLKDVIKCLGDEERIDDIVTSIYQYCQMRGLVGVLENGDNITCDKALKQILGEDTIRVSDLRRLLLENGLLFETEAQKIEYTLARSKKEGEYSDSAQYDFDFDLESLYHEEAQEILKRVKTREVEEMICRQNGLDELVKGGLGKEEAEEVMDEVEGGREEEGNQKHIMYMLGKARANGMSESESGRVAAESAKLLYVEGNLKAKRARIAELGKFVEEMKK